MHGMCERMRVVSQPVAASTVGQTFKQGCSRLTAQLRSQVLYICAWADIRKQDMPWVDEACGMLNLLRGGVRIKFV
jgi:hypothetical protein